MKSEPSGDKLGPDVLKQLASRYVVGDISKEEYKELKEILSKWMAIIIGAI
jgi:hypothetical protein